MHFHRFCFVADGVDLPRWPRGCKGRTAFGLFGAAIVSKTHLGHDWRARLRGRWRRPIIPLGTVHVRGGDCLFTKALKFAVALVLVEGLSYKEAAEVLEVPQGTLTSRLGRGRAALLADLQEDRA